MLKSKINGALQYLAEQNNQIYDVYSSKLHYRLQFTRVHKFTNHIVQAIIL